MTDDPIQTMLAVAGRLEFGHENLGADVKHRRAGRDRLRGDLMGRMDCPQHEIGLVRDALVIDSGGSDHALCISKGPSDDVRGGGEMLTTMQRRIMHLQTDVEQLRGGGAAGYH